MSVESVMLCNHLILCHLFTFCLESFPVSGSFPMSQLFPSGDQSIEASASVLPMNIQGWFPLGLTGLISLLIFMANSWRNNEKSDRLCFLGLKNHCRWWLQPWNEKTLAPWKKSYDKPRKQRHYLTDKGPSSQSYGFSSSCVWMWVGP